MPDSRDSDGTNPVAGHGHVNLRHVLIHAIAFVVAAAIGAVLVRPLYPLFEMQTDNAADAMWAYALCCFIAGGVGVLVTACIFEFPQLIRRVLRR
jgi:H+/Cl- antiporter ClcA